MTPDIDIYLREHASSYDPPSGYDLGSVHVRWAREPLWFSGGDLDRALNEWGTLEPEDLPRVLAEDRKGGLVHLAALIYMEQL